MALVICAVSSPALAAPEEIRVYMDEMQKQGHFGFDTHIHDVTDSAQTDDYPG